MHVGYVERLIELEASTNSKRTHLQKKQERARADGSSSAGTQKIFFISIIAKWLKYLLKTRRFVEPLKDSLIEMPFSSLLDNLLSMPHKRFILILLPPPLPKHL